MPAWATKMVALPFGFSIRNELFGAHAVGSARILVAVVGMLPASQKSIIG